MRAVTGSTALRFRAATPADVPAIVALVESAYRGDSSRAGWTTEADLLEGQRTDAGGVLALVANPLGRVVLAERGGVLEACRAVASATPCWPNASASAASSGAAARCA